MPRTYLRLLEDTSYSVDSYCRASADKANIGADGQLIGGDAYGVDAAEGSDANTLDATEKDAATVRLPDRYIHKVVVEA